MKRLFAIVLVLALMLSSVALADSVYTAGVYTSVQMGHNDVVVVETELSEDAILRVEVVEHSETPGICEKPIEEIPEAIIASQSLAVDTVTGATMISNAIINGVADAIAQAGGNPELLLATPITEPEQRGEDEEITTQVAVVGGGASGTAAALTALQHGAEVVLLEKTATPIGAGTAGCSIFAADSRLQIEDGSEVTNEWIYNQIMETSNYQANGALVSNIVRNSGATVDWLLDNGVNLTHLPAGMAAGSLKMERENQATANSYVDGGIVALRHLHEEIIKAGGEIRYETPAYQILVEDGVVSGVIARKTDGGILTVHSDSVIIATGGFTNNAEMLAEYFPGHDFGHNDVVGGAEGDGLKMLWEVGTGKTNIVAQCYGIQPITEGGFVDPLYGPLISPILFVNNQGTRITNEFEIGEATASSDILRSVPNEELYSIFDTTLIETMAESGLRGLIPDIGKSYEGIEKSYVEVGWETTSEELLAAYTTPMDLADHLESQVEQGYIVKADTIDELAEKLNMPKLVATVERYNALCEKGADEDFFKGAEYMDAVAKGPFYAAKYEYVNFIGTLGGGLVDETLQACEQNGTPIANLWAVGLDAGGMYGNSYVFFEGGSLGFAYISGHLAGVYAAENALK